MSNPKLSVGERLGWQKCENHKLRLFCTEADEIVDWAGHICREGVHQELEHVCVDGWTPPAELVERTARAFHENYERLAPEFGYQTREATRTPWPPSNADLMRATARAVLVEQARWIGEQ